MSLAAGLVRILGCAIAAWSLAATMVASAPALVNDLIVDTQYLRVSIGGRTVRFEAVFVKRADARGSLPIALMSHGRPPSAWIAHDQSLTDDDPGLPTMGDIARRGWLVAAVHRRGYGRSDGPDQIGTDCSPGTFMTWMNADADDMQAALSAIARRPDADASRIIAIGASAGGATSVALGARNPPGLRAVINIAGGEHLAGCSLVDQTIPVDFKDLGSRSRVPNLWVFAANDLNHPPAQVEAMRAAFTAAGGSLKLVQTDAIGENGHSGLIFSTPGRTRSLAATDDFLRSLNLPTWSTSSLDVAMQRLRWPENSRAFLQAYLAAPGERAFARTPGGANAAFNVGPTLDAARTKALDACQAKGQHCVIVMENDRLVNQP